MVEAQTKQQQAIVKTHGRLQDDGSVKVGRRIADALVELKDGAKIFSDELGELSFSISVSDGYCLSKVSIEGYTLSDWDIISRQQQYSETPVDILLESIEEQKAYRRNIERKVRRNYTAQLEILQDRIDSLKTAADADKEEIAKLQAHIDESYDLSEKYVDEMTNRYLKIDFDHAEEFDRIISAYILNGELEKADSMLATKGDIVKRIQQNKNMQEVVMRDKEELAKDCYRKYEIASQRLERDSAAYYLELRANLDPHNIDWQIDAAEFIRIWLADYKRTLAIYEPALEYSRLYYGELHLQTSVLYINTGIVYCALGNFKTATEYLNKALNIRKTNSNFKSPNTAILYQNIAALYQLNGDFDMALKYFKKALEIRINVLGIEDFNTAQCYLSIGVTYSLLCNYKEALEYSNKALNIFEKTLGVEDINTARVYYSKGIIYGIQQNYEKALENFQKALKIQSKILGQNHPDTAVSYLQIGQIYFYIGDYEKALENGQKALEINENIFGLENINTATSHSLIGGVYIAQGDYDKALEHYNKILNISEKVFGLEHFITILPNLSLGIKYYNQMNYKKALEYFSKVLEASEKFPVINNELKLLLITSISDLEEKIQEEQKLIEILTNLENKIQK